MPHKKVGATRREAARNTEEESWRDKPLRSRHIFSPLRLSPSSTRTGRLARNIDSAKEKRLAALLKCAARPHGGEKAGAGMRCPITARNSQSSQARPPAAHRPARTDEGAGYSAQRSPDPICQGSEKARRTWVRLRADPSAVRGPRSLPRRRSVGDQDFGRTYALGANKRKQRGSLGGRKPHTAVRRTSPKRACRVAGVDRVPSIREEDGVGHRSVVPLLGIVHLGKVERPESSCRRLVVRSPG